ncbi:MAG TPA: polysaccharide deacetylase family protein [Patescibacteria group bacterium]
MKNINALSLVILFSLVVMAAMGLMIFKTETTGKSIKNKIANKITLPTVTSTAMPTPTEAISTPAPTVTAAPASPSAKIVSFSDMNKLYGPCTQVPVLMYHHIQPEEDAKKNGSTGLTVTPDWFRKHMAYLKEKGYTTIWPEALTGFFDKGIKLPAKAVIITLDDAYEDNYTHAYPILKEFGLKATIFTPTGLVMNPDYLTWDQIKEMNASGLVYFGNHTWSHHSSAGTLEVQDKEISIADTQLAEHGQNSDKIFAYPYGKPSSDAEMILGKYKYNMAFTTTHGTIMCQKQRYILPRIRIGNAELKRFGL